MSWTYSGNPGSSTLDEVRFLIGDTDTNDQLLSNEELQWLIDKWSDAYSAAISAVTQLLSQAARSTEQNKKVGDLSLSIKNNARLAQWESLLSHLKNEQVRNGAVAPLVNPNSLVPTSERDRDDEPGTDFYLGQMDNL